MRSILRKNNRHLQSVLISNINDLPENHHERQESSWARVFYREIFRRLDESSFGVLYTDIPSRPTYLSMYWSKFVWKDLALKQRRSHVSSHKNSGPQQ
jgi:hypothetical protein